jgi:hypothetical protein
MRNEEPKPAPHTYVQLLNTHDEQLNVGNILFNKKMCQKNWISTYKRTA